VLLLACPLRQGGVNMPVIKRAAMAIGGLFAPEATEAS
jgi:hypothetical protein